MIRIRALGFGDEPLLPHFLALAAHERNTETALLNPQLARYVAEWGRDGDTAVVAEDEETRAIVGVAWARLWTSDNRGFGFVDEQTPELAVAVEAEFQGRGLGTQLIAALECRLRAQPLAGASVSLSVRAGSPAVRLYERLGFTRIEGSERTNRMSGVSFNMSAPLREGQWHYERLRRSFVLAQGDAPRFFVHVEFLARLRLNVFTGEEIERFEVLMGSLPGAGQSTGSGANWKTTFNYYGLDTGKTASHDANLWARISSEGLRVSGAVYWDQWCEWEDAFLAEARNFPHEMHSSI